MFPFFSGSVHAFELKTFLFKLNIKATRKVTVCFCCNLVKVQPYLDWTKKIRF